MNQRAQMSPYSNNSYSIRQEIQRFESVHPSIYAIYDLIEAVPDPLIQSQIREHVVSIEDSFVNSQEWTISRSVPDLKLGILGTVQSGKSALVHRYLTGSYMQEESPEGGRFKKEVMIDGSSHLLLIRDEGGEPEMQFTHWVDAIIFVFSLEDERSFKAIYTYYAKMGHFRNTAEIPIILVGTQDAISESNPRLIDDSRARKLASDLKRCSYYETCAMYGLNVERVFQEACQKIIQLRMSGLTPNNSRPNTPNQAFRTGSHFSPHTHAQQMPSSKSYENQPSSVASSNAATSSTHSIHNSPGTLTPKDHKHDKKHKHKGEHKDLYRDRGDRERASELQRASDPPLLYQGHVMQHGVIPVNPPSVPANHQLELIQQFQQQFQIEQHNLQLQQQQQQRHDVTPGSTPIPSRKNNKKSSVQKSNSFSGPAILQRASSANGEYPLPSSTPQLGRKNKTSKSFSPTGSQIEAQNVYTTAAESQPQPTSRPSRTTPVSSRTTPTPSRTTPTPSRTTPTPSRTTPTPSRTTPTPSRTIPTPSRTTPTPSRTTPTPSRTTPTPSRTTPTPSRTTPQPTRTTPQPTNSRTPDPTSGVTPVLGRKEARYRFSLIVDKMDGFLKELQIPKDSPLTPLLSRIPRVRSSLVVEKASSAGAMSGDAGPTAPGGESPTPSGTPTQKRKDRRRSNLFSKKGEDDKNKQQNGMLGVGRPIPIKQGLLYKKSNKPLSKDWKKKYVTLGGGRLAYHPNLNDYRDNVHGKEINLMRTTVKVPGQKPRGARSQSESTAASAPNGKQPPKDGSVLITAFDEDAIVIPNSALNSDLSVTPNSKIETPNVKKRHHKRMKSGAKNIDTGPDMDSDGYEFHIVSLDNKQWHFEATTQEEREEWVSAVEQQILSSLQGNQTNKCKEGLGHEVVQDIRRIAGNQTCADCGDKNPEWASLNLGTLICIECSGIHRNLGTHLSRVRSLTLDDWPAEYVAVMAQLGNKAVNSIWEAELKGRTKPSPASSREEKENWIRCKYETKEFLPPPPYTDVPLPQQLIDAIARQNVIHTVLVLGHAQPDDVNAPYSQPDTRTALHIAAALGNVVLIQLLLWYGANVKMVDHEGRNALWYAHSSGSRECVELLRQQGCPESGTLQRRRASSHTQPSMQLSNHHSNQPSHLPSNESLDKMQASIKH